MRRAAILIFAWSLLVILRLASFAPHRVYAQFDNTLPNALVLCKPPCEPAENAQSTDTQPHPYLEQPLDQLRKRIPELKGIKPAASQEELAMILRRTGAAVDEFFTHVVDVIAREEIIQEKQRTATLNSGMPGGLAGFRRRTRDSYLILRQLNGSRADINEFRMNDQGSRVDEGGLDKGFLMTSGFALSVVNFSSLAQWESRFLHLGDQKIGGRDSYVIAFAQLPDKTRNVVKFKAAGTSANLFVQGIAWVDKTNFQIVQMRTDLLSPQPDIGLDEETTEISFMEVRFPDVAVPLWLPRDVKIDMRFAAGKSIEILRNVHRYTDYRRYRVSAKILAPN